MTNDPAPRAADDSGAAVRLEPLRLLCIEHDPAQARRLRLELDLPQAAACEIEHAARLATAVQRLQARSFDAVLVSPPEPEAAVESCRSLADAAGDVPLVFQLDDAALADALPLLRAGAHDVIPRGLASGLEFWRRLRFAVARTAHARQRRHLLARLSPTPAASSADPSPPSSGPLRNVLVIDDDLDLAGRLAERLPELHAGPLVVERRSTVADAVACLAAGRFDAVLADDGLAGEPIERLLEPHLGAAPLVVLSWNDDPLRALAALAHGADDFLLKSEAVPSGIHRALELGVARRSRPLTPPAPRRSRDGDKSRSAGETWSDWRKHPRYLASASLLVVPILPDGGPDAEPAEGALVDISAAGIGFETNLARLPTLRRLVLGVETGANAMHFATVEVRNHEPSGRGFHVGARFVQASFDPLSEEFLEPRFDPRKHRYQVRVDPRIAGAWARLGVMRPVIRDRILVCPECQGVPLARRGCRRCGSIHLAQARLMHHFACAHVGYVADFERDGKLRCPKCRLAGLVVGADFEYLDGPFSCLDCRWSDNDLADYGRCLGCSLHFPWTDAVELDLIGYHVHRLDPLGLVSG